MKIIFFFALGYSRRFTTAILNLIYETNSSLFIPFIAGSLIKNTGKFAPQHLKMYLNYFKIAFYKVDFVFS